jgi:DNA polymerase-1
MRAERLHSEMILQVHDELVFRVPTAELQTMGALVAEIMTGAMQEVIKDVPIQVDVHAGTNWAEMKPVTSRVGAGN